MPVPLVLRNTIPRWERWHGQGPVVAVALHNGHLVPPELAALLAVTEETRLREEDPYTGEWTAAVPNRFVVRWSRFIFDLNRPPERAVYQTPADAWGIPVWKSPPQPELLHELQAHHQAFYAEIKTVFDDLQARWGKFVVLDLHAYNHRREGPDNPAALLADNPEINVGTRSLNRQLWGPLVDRFMADMRTFDYLGRHLDVRENIKFQGGELAQWTHRNYPETGCVLAVEVKKFFMDEWTGALYPDQFDALGQALQATLPGIHEVLTALAGSRQAVGPS